MSDDHEHPLARAARHVASARRIVADQKARIERLESAGLPHQQYDAWLQTFEQTLRVLEDDQRDLQRDLRCRSGLADAD